MLKTIKQKIASFKSSKKQEKQNSYTIDPNDIFLVSYPKSGNTWLRFLIGNYFSANQCDFTNIHSIIPDIHYDPSKINKIKEPRIIKSHNSFCPKYRKVIYLVRDGRDVAVSYYYHYLKFKQNQDSISFNEYLKQFNAGQVDYGLWADHINSWLDNFNSIDKYLIIKYEDIHKNPFDSLKKVIKFAELSIDEERIKKSVESSKLENMQSIEKKQSDYDPILSKTDNKINFVRSGQVGEWQSLFTESMKNEFLKIHGNALAKLNYI